MNPEEQLAAARDLLVRGVAEPPSSASLVAAMASLAVAAVVLARRRRSPGTGPLLVACAGLIVWHLADFFSERLGFPTWMLVAALGTVAIPPSLIHFVWRTLGIGPSRLVRASWWMASVFYVAVLAGFFLPDTGAHVLRWGWVPFLVLFGPPLVGSLALLLRAARRAREPGARLRALRLAFGIGVGLVAGVFDLFAMAYPSVPKLGSLGTIAGSLALGWSLDADAAARGAVATRSALLAVALTAGAFLLTIAVSDLLRQRQEAVLLVGGGTALAALAAFRLGMARIQREADRVRSLALLGTLAAEVAHEVRNPLAAIRGAVQYLREEARRKGLGEEFDSYFELVDDEVERLDQVVTGYHSLARPGAAPVARVDAGKVVRDVATLQEKALPTTVQLRVDVAEGLPAVRGDAGRLRQALVNLVRNAIQAMPNGGTLVLRAGTDSRRWGERLVALEVEDSGAGLSASALDSIGTPFFTTTEGGSGLGLAVTRRIADEHGGHLVVRHATGGGSTFAIVLPALREPEGSQRPPEPTPDGAAT